MRTIALLFASACIASAAPLKDTQGVVHMSAPSVVDLPEGVAQNPSEALLLLSGWSYATQSEIDADAAARALAASNAMAQASLPLQAPNGIAVQDEDGRWIELEPTGDGLPVIGNPVSHSPLEPGVRKEMKAAGKAAHEVLREEAKKSKLGKNEVDEVLLKAVFGEMETKK